MSLSGEISPAAGRQPAQSTGRPLLSMVQDGLLVIAAAIFFWSHMRRLLEDGSLASAGFSLEQGLLIWMFLTRRRPAQTSTRVLDWIVAAGGWLPLLMRPDPAGGGLEISGVAIQLIGLGGTCYAFLHLGRNFGVVAAYRGLEVRGPYRLVRHPIYLSHMVTTSGFLLANPSPANAAVFAGFAAATVLRIQAEERLLREACDYQGYAGSVRWRLLPGVF